VKKRLSVSSTAHAQPIHLVDGPKQHPTEKSTMHSPAEKHNLMFWGVLETQKHKKHKVFV
jgi:hypothetical protein